jgi:hypothetical protein
MSRLKKFKWRKLLAFSTDILTKIPSRQDNILVNSLKVLSIIDSFNKQIGKGNSTAISSFFLDLDLEEVTNAQFVSLFFSTGLHTTFTINRIEFGDFVDIVKATRSDIGTLYFIEWHWGSKPQPADNFYHTKSFDFNKSLAVLWEIFHNRIHLDLSQDNQNKALKSNYSEIPSPQDCLFGNTIDKLNEFKEQHLLYMRDNVPRTYLFCGKQGIGKTSFCLKLAQLTEGRVLRIDACGLTAVSVKDLDFIIQGLGPDFLIVDDIDRAPDLNASLPTLFTILSDFKHKHPNVTICLTINDITKLDAALIRPGRIDEIIEMDLPTKEERKDILKGYLDTFGITKEVDLDTISNVTEGLTAAYLQEVALQLKYRTQDKVLILVKRMNELSNTPTNTVIPAGTTK